jgi:hypothetical protein
VMRILGVLAEENLKSGELASESRACGRPANHVPGHSPGYASSGTRSSVIVDDEPDLDTGSAETEKLPWRRPGAQS